jgi:DNA-directed RNA polymerase beta' subunit
LEDLARRLITAGGVIERSLALDLILNNEFRSLEDDVRTLLDERRNGASIARKARSTLERLGFNIDDDA